MADLSLELPDAIIDDLGVLAAANGCTVEEFIREFMASVRRRHANSPGAQGLGDEAADMKAEVEEQYRRLGYRCGWRFVTCPWANAGTAKLLLVTLNPAGREIHGPAWSQETGSAYRVESWGGRPAGAAILQRQVQQLFGLLGLQDSDVFSAHYVPFRSPTWHELEHRPEAESFARELWRWLMPQVSFDQVVCIGKDKPGKPIAALLQGTLEGSFPVGWGGVTADRYRLPDGRPLVALPHLSRFTIFGRPEGEAALKALFQC